MENLVDNNENEDISATGTANEQVMSDQESPESESMEDLMSLYEESFKRFAEGEVVKGRIISVVKKAPSLRGETWGLSFFPTLT